jgi:hypothetical protein
LTDEHRPDLLGGLTVVHATADVAAAPESGSPYRDPSGKTEPTVATGVRVTAIPYYAWANRDIGAMRVWVPSAEPIR